MKVAVFGPKELVLTFKGLGIDVFFKGEKNEEELKKIIENGYKLILVSEDVLADINYRDYIYLPDITLLPIPGITGKEGIGKSILREILKKAVGIDVGGLND
uniref:V-type ATP synthase subunit F n=1 Tax=candidate division WOR-3 bacterium TaxID=2052148 RepID=A0A7C4U7C1_UNCW3